MPTIVRFAGYRVVIYPNDHRPEHVHVIGRGVEAVFEVNCPNGDRICAAWEEIHGER
jgi:hypothetical protein